MLSTALEGKPQRRAASCGVGKGGLRGTCAGGAGAGPPIAGGARRQLSGAKRRPLSQECPRITRPQILARTRKKTPEVIARIEELMKHEVAGDPCTGLKWTRRTTQKIARD